MRIIRNILLTIFGLTLGALLATAIYVMSVGA